MPGQAALASYHEQDAIGTAATRAAAEVWRDLDPTRFSASWDSRRIGDQLFLTLARSQELAATAAVAATAEILAEDGITDPPDARVNASSVAGVASDGRDLEGLLLQPLITANVAQASGAPPAEAMLAGLTRLTRIVQTQVHDAGRTASGLSVVARPRIGYVRLVEPGACSRCIVLAGRFYRWSSGFLRHPMCRCRNIPAAEDTPELTAASDPMTAFRSLSEEEQNRQFTKAGARAIRDGADIFQVVNARRGALGLSAPGRLTTEERKLIGHGHLQRTDVYGRAVYVTAEGTTKRGLAGARLISTDGAAASRELAGARHITRERAKSPRLMPESIYELAKDREDALRLLRRFGYLI